MSIEHVEYSEHTARTARGEIYFADGEVVLVRTDHEVGVAALARIQGWRQANYTFYEDATVPLDNIRASHPQNIVDMPHTNAPGKYAIFRAYPSTATPATMKSLERRERIVFALLDG